MSPLRSLCPHSRNGVRRLLQEERGAVIIWVAVGIFTFILFMGAAVDLARGQMLRTKLAKSIDAAALAGAAAMTLGATEDEAEEQARQFFAMNFNVDGGSNFMRSRLSNINAEVVRTETGTRVVTVSGDAQIDTLFMKLAGQDVMNVGTQAQAARSMRSLELTFVLDYTGSMYVEDRIGGLRQATTGAINKIFDDKMPTQDVYISLVPYSSSVNIGTSRTNWLSNPARLAEFPPSAPWRGCVEVRPGGEANDDPPTANLWPVYLYPSTAGQPETADVLRDNDWTATDTNEDITFTGDVNALNTIYGPNMGCAPTMLVGSNDRNELLDRITNMKPEPRGGTLTNLGVAWGWRTLSPRWRGVWDNGDPDFPRDYNDEEFFKGMIIITDGINTFWNQRRDSVSDYTAYGRIPCTPPGNTCNASNPNGGSEISTGPEMELVIAEIEQLCTEIKGNGVDVYTITFGSRAFEGINPDLYRACASSPDKYFHAPDGDALQDVFSRILNSIMFVRLVQ